MMAVVASIFSALGSAVSSKWGEKINGRSASYFAGAQSFGGLLMLLFFSVVLLVTLHYLNEHVYRQLLNVQWLLGSHMLSVFLWTDIEELDVGQSVEMV